MKQRGFTLLEILVAVFIVAIISIIMIRGLQTVLSTKRSLDRNGQQLSQFSLAMDFLQSDLTNIINRPITAADQSRRAALLLNDDAKQTLEFTRANVSNPLAARRSTLQRVAYQLDAGKLVRLTWPVLDPVVGTQPTPRVLLTDVTRLQWQFIGADHRLYLAWPPRDVANGSSGLSLLPKGIRLIVTLAKRGQIERVFALNNQMASPDKSKNSNKSRSSGQNHNNQKNQR